MKRFALGLLIVACPLTGAAEEDIADSFKGNVVMVMTDEDLGYPLLDVKVQTLAHRQLVAGVGADSHRDDDWVKGKKLRIPIDRIALIVIFTPKEWETRAEEWKARRP